VSVGKGAPTRIVVMSDTHSKEAVYLSSAESTLPMADILIIAGDFTQSGQLEEYKQFNSFLKALGASMTYKHIVFIAGNHERTLDEEYYLSEGWRYDQEQQDPIACRNALFFELPPNVHYLCDSSVTLEGLLIYGSPWVIGGDVLSSETSPAHFRWGFSLSEDSLAHKWRSIPPQVDILVTHQPPYGAGDLKRDYDGDSIVDERQVFAYEHQGSLSLMREVQRLQPLLHVCGHEHVGHGAFSYPDCSTIVINAALCDEDYSPSQCVVVVDVESPRQSINFIAYSTSGRSSATEHSFEEKGLDFYLAALLSLENSSIALTDTQKDSLLLFLRLVTCPSHAMVPNSQLPTSRPSGVVSSVLQRIGLVDSRTTRITELILEHKRALLAMLDDYGLLAGLYHSRRLSRGADLDSAADFRSMQLVVPRVFLGPEYPAQDHLTLSEKGITHIVNCSGLPPAFPSDFAYLSVELADAAEEDISRFFGPAIAFIESALETPSARVLIHCHLGLSRSPSLVIAYLMHSKNLSFTIAHSITKRARGFISINEGFIDQLMEADRLNPRADKVRPFFS
jgi:Icc-related predicted phosphoesterase